MTPTEMLAQLPDDATLPVGFVRKLVAEVVAQGPDPRAVLTTGEAADRFGYSADWWRRAAPDVPGAYQDEGARGYWRLPVLGCTEHLARLQARRRSKPRSRRGPWTPKEADLRAQDLHEAAVVRRGPETVGRGQADDAEPTYPRLA